jgi:hypothetical protein
VDLYTFIVSKFEIFNTRALITDTLAFGWAAYADGQEATPMRIIAPHIGFDEGQYSVSEVVPSDTLPGLARVVINDPDAQVVFSFQLLNAYNVPDGALTGRVAATSDQLAGITAGVAGAAGVASGVFWAAIVLEALVEVYSWLTVDCDGPVAVDQISGPRYMLDALTDTPERSIKFDRQYGNSESPDGCGGNSNYEVWWSLSHSRSWVQVEDFSSEIAVGRFTSETGVAASAHYGAVHAFGVGDGPSLGFPPGPVVTHARTFTGALWTVDAVGSFALASLPGGTPSQSLPVSAVSFDDRLHVFGILSDGSISSLAYTVDGGSWIRQAGSLGGLHTAEPIATVVFRYRLHVFARDSTTHRLRMTSTSDLATWNPWVDVVEPTGFPPVSSVAATALHDTLHIFGVYQNTKDSHQGTVIMHKSTPDGVMWTGWDVVEGGAHPEGPTDEPLDVAAGIFRERIYLATRWNPTSHLALNFSGDGTDWSGWRIPQYDTDPQFDLPDLQFGGTTALAPVGNHLYIFGPALLPNKDGQHTVWAY